jgi:DtxR family Mn-dependent transcriptional regulator
MAASLARHGLVERSRYRGIRLTRRGRHAAVRALRAHRLAEAFLVRVMGYGWHEAHGLADSLAGIADDRFVDEMEAKAGYPRRCPHGEPIPTRSGELPAIEDRPLEEAEIGWEGRVGRVRTRDPERLQYLASVGLVPDAPLAVVARAPFRGPVRVRVAGAEVVLGSELSRTVFVEERPAVPSTAA